VSQSRDEPVRCYIARQQERHTRMRFEDELVSVLKRHHMEYDERYLLGLTSTAPSGLGLFVELLTQGSAGGSTLGYFPSTLRVLGGGLELRSDWLGA
jgi:hypothetical protein